MELQMENEKIEKLQSKSSKGLLSKDTTNPSKSLSNLKMKSTTDKNTVKIANERSAFGDVTNNRNGEKMSEDCLSQTTLSKPRLHQEQAVSKIAPSSHPIIDKQVHEASESGMRDGSSTEEDEILLHTPSEKRPLSNLEMSISLQFDKSNEDNIAEVPQYAQTVFAYMRNEEYKYMISPMYMSVQPSISWKMRRMLIDWLVDLLEALSLNHESLYLAVKLTDTYLSRVVISKDDLQLVGATAMFIAAKYDERVPACSEDILYLCDDAYSSDELFASERKLLIAVDFKLNPPLSYRFLRRFAKCARVDMERLTLARYLLELSLLHESFLEYLDSKLAAACLWLSFKVRLPNLAWDRVVEHYSGYKETDIVLLAEKLNNVMEQAPRFKYQTSRKKYLTDIFFAVADSSPLSLKKIKAEKDRILSIL